MSSVNEANYWTSNGTTENNKLAYDRGCKLSSGTVSGRKQNGSVSSSRVPVAAATRRSNDDANAGNDDLLPPNVSNARPMEVFTSPSGTMASTITAEMTTTSSKRGKTTSLMYTRAIFEVGAVRSLGEHLVCPKCQSLIQIETPTVSIASGLRLKRRNDFCSFLEIKRPASTDFDLPDTAGSALITRTTYFAVNILFVLSMICSGDGPRLLVRQEEHWDSVTCPIQQLCRHAILQTLSSGCRLSSMRLPTNVFKPIYKKKSNWFGAIDEMTMTCFYLIYGRTEHCWTTYCLRLIF